MSTTEGISDNNEKAVVSNDETIAQAGQENPQEPGQGDGMNAPKDQTQQQMTNVGFGYDASNNNLGQQQGWNANTNPMMYMQNGMGVGNWPGFPHTMGNSDHVSCNGEFY